MLFLNYCISLVLALLAFNAVRLCVIFAVSLLLLCSALDALKIR